MRAGKVHTDRHHYICIYHREITLKQKLQVRERLQRRRMKAKRQS